MPDYSKGKIYKLVSNNTDDFYVGSTTQDLYDRRAGHIHMYNLYTYHDKKCKYDTSFEIIKKGDSGIILIEDYSCNSREELQARERHWIEKLNCINKEKLASSCKKEKNEYYKSHKDEIKLIRKQYYESHKDKIILRKKQYYQTHKEKAKLRSKQYNIDNKEKIKMRKTQKINCTCGVQVQHGASKRHYMSKKHRLFELTLMQEIYEYIKRLSVHLNGNAFK